VQISTDRKKYINILYSGTFLVVMDEVKLGRYQHYKGRFYEVIGIAKHSESLEELVVYKALYDSKEFGNDALWVRPKAMFLEKVEIGGKRIPRFRYVG
jgi:hypothetical protein